MPIIALLIGAGVVAGLGGYAIHSVSTDTGAAIQSTGKGLSTGVALVGAGIGVAVVVWAIKKH